jgi:hypothetical protein
MDQQELWGLGFFARKVELLEQQGFEEKRTRATVFMTLKIC